MAGKPKPISAKTREAWGRGDVPMAERLSGLKERRLRDRLGAPGGAPATPAATPAGRPTQRLAQVQRGAKAGPSPAPSSPPNPGATDPRRAAILAAVGAALDADLALLDVAPEELAARLADADPTDEEIAALDTRTEAAKILIKMSRRVDRAPDVRLGTVAGKVLDAVNRLEQIDRRRPPPAAPDAAQEAVRQAMAESTEHLLRHTVPAAERWGRLLPRLRVALGIAAPDLLRELDVLTGGATA